MFHSKKWICGYPDREKIKNLTKAMGISPILAEVLVNRGLGTKEDAEEFLYPDSSRLAGPFLMPDMEVSVERIVGALELQEKICIYGDYDVDGITAVSVMMRFLTAARANAFFYIPSRMDEGYGLNKAAIEEIHKMGARLIITVDCGITSFEEVELCNRLDIDVIVTDHHQCQQKLPSALGIINPKREDSVYPFSQLAGVGVAYKLCSALETRIKAGNIADGMLDLVALGTVADIVPLTGENRILVSRGLKQMAETTNVGLNALMQVAGIEAGPINTGQVAFMLAPRINASGRLSVAEKGVRLFLTESSQTAISIAKVMDGQNRERQAVESGIFEQAAAMAERNKDHDILVLSSHLWHPGVIGIAASKIVERYNKPAILFHIDGREARGSARSIPGLDLYQLLSKCGHFYKSFGGHKQAAGLTLETDRLEEFTREINLIAREIMRGMDGKYIIKADGDLTGTGISVKDAAELKMLEPCGCGNPSPLFIKRHVRAFGVKKVGKNNEHLKLTVDEKGSKCNCIAFRWRNTDRPVSGQRLDVLFSPQINQWLGKEDLQLVIKDMKSLESQGDFLKSWYNSIMELDDHGTLAAEPGVELHDRIEIQKTDDSCKFLADQFNRSTGNVVLVNGYREVVDMVSMLGMYPNTEVHFGCAGDCSGNANYILVHPYSIEEMKSCPGRLYFFGHSVLPGQLQAIVRLHDIKPIMLVNENADCLGSEMRGIIPDRKILAQIYRFIKNSNGTAFDICLMQMIKMGINPATWVLAIEGMRNMDLIGIRDCELFALPAPENKVKLHQARPFQVIKTMANTAESCCCAVKNSFFDI